VASPVTGYGTGPCADWYPKMENVYRLLRDDVENKGFLSTLCVDLIELRLVFATFSVSMGRDLPLISEMM
jgi:hypothetical protein